MGSAPLKLVTVVSLLEVDHVRDSDSLRPLLTKFDEVAPWLKSQVWLSVRVLRSL